MAARSLIGLALLLGCLLAAVAAYAIMQRDILFERYHARLKHLAVGDLQGFWSGSASTEINATEGGCLHIGTKFALSWCPHEYSGGINAAVEDGRRNGGVCSQYFQDKVLAAIFNAITIGSKPTFVEFGARRPQVLNSAHFRLNCNWSGLLLDRGPGLTPWGKPYYADLQSLLHAKDDAPVRLRQAFLTRENANSVFQSHKVAQHVDLLSIDIGRNDYWVLRGLLEAGFYTPRVLAVEFSSYFGPDEAMVNKYNDGKGMWDGRSVNGASLRALNDLLAFHEYQYITQVAGEHAIWVHSREFRPEAPEIMLYKGISIPQERIQEGWQSRSKFYNPKDFIAVLPNVEPNLTP